MLGVLPPDQENSAFVKSLKLVCKLTIKRGDAS